MTRTTARRAALILAGLAMTGGAALGIATTAHAAAPTTTPAGHTANGYGWNGEDEEIVAVFRTYGQCRHAARVGERRGYWDEADCEFVRTGYRGHWRSQWGTPFHRAWHGHGWHYRGVWVLRAECGCDD